MSEKVAAAMHGDELDPGTITVPPTAANLPPMTREQLAGILHSAVGTLGPVAYYPRGCGTCEQALNLHRYLWPEGTQ